MAAPIGDDTVKESQKHSAQKKPCRTCTDFKSWAKSKGVNFTQIPNGQHSAASRMAEKPDPECPLDREGVGNSTWSFLHTMAAYYPDTPTTRQQSEMKQFVNLLSKFYPCEDCAEHLRDKLKTSQPETRTRYELVQWFCRMHNDVNKRVGKPAFDCKKVDERWRDGWKDGSCE